MKRTTFEEGLIVEIPEDFELIDSKGIPGQNRGNRVFDGAIPFPEATGDEDGEEKDAIIGALEQSGLEVLKKVEIKPRASVLKSRGRAAGENTATLQVDLKNDENAVVLVEQDGLYLWKYPEKQSKVARKRTRGVNIDDALKRLMFSIEVSTTEAEGASSRTIFGKIVEFGIGSIKTYVLKFVAGKTVKLALEMLEKDIKPALIRINSPDPSNWKNLKNLDQLELPTAKQPRILLFVHGTFSSTVGAYSALSATPWGLSFLEAALNEYDAVLGFDHLTLKEDPLENAQELLKLFSDWKGRAIAVDIICHSRGGLVVRSLIESLLSQKSVSPLEVKRAIFVGVTNEGTLLAELDNWESLIDLYTNLVTGASRAIGMINPGTAVATIMIAEVIKNVGAFVKYCGSAAVKKRGIPGLAAMEPNGDFIRDINKLQKGQPMAAQCDYCIITSDFEAKLTGDHEPKEFSKRLIGWFAGGFMKQLTKEANDLVVHTRSMGGIDRQFGDFVKEKYEFGNNSQVYHTNYFSRPEVADALVNWLKLTVSIPEPKRRGGGGGHYGDGGRRSGMDMDMGENEEFDYEMEALDDDIVDEVKRTHFDAFENIVLPADLKIEIGDKALADATALAEIAKWLGDDNYAGSEILYKRAMPKMSPNEQEIYERPGFSIGFEMTKAKPKPTSVCHIHAAIDQEIITGKETDLKVTLSAEAIDKAVNEAANAGVVHVDETKKLILTVIAKKNIRLVKESEGRMEIDLPLPAEQLELFFTMKAEAEGMAEVWVVLRQTQIPLLKLVLKPTVVENKSKATGTISVEQEALPAKAPAKPIHQLWIEDNNLAEVVYKYTIYSEGLKIRKKFTSATVKGDRKAYIDNLYKKIEDRWLGSKQSQKNILQELRSFGNDLLTELIPVELQKVLWERRADLDSIQVVSNEPFIPWELIHLKDPDKRGMPVEMLFLGQMGLVRWLDGAGKGSWPPEQILVRKGKAKYVIPDYPHPNYKLPHALLEKDFLERVFGATAIEPKTEVVRDLIGDAGSFDLLHFACHGVATSEQIADAALLMEGKVENGQYILDPFKESVAKAFSNLERDDCSPMVVLNACQAGRAGYKLTGIGGFADAFLSAGAGAFVGTLWSVGDSPARLFTETLYEALKDGLNLAAATIKARNVCMEKGDATWLAYVVYGHPHMTMKIE